MSSPTNDAGRPRGAQRAAAFLLSLEREVAASLLEKLEPAALREVAAAMAELDPRFEAPDLVASVYKDLARHVAEPKRLRSAAEPELASLLEGGVGRERANALVSEIRARRRVERPFAALEKAPEAAVRVVLARESSAVVALVLAHLDPAISARFLSRMDPDRALDVVRRMAKLVPPEPEALARIADALDGALAEAAKLPAEPDPKRRLETVAKLINFAEAEIGKLVLEGLDSSDGEMAAEIREFLFTWTDLAVVDKRGMQKILSSIETRTLAVALKACPADVEANVMQNLSSRVRAMVADERDLAGAVPMAEVVAAREEILRCVRALMESGEFKPVRAGEELVD